MRTTRKVKLSLDNEAIHRSLCVPEAFAVIFDRHFDSIRGYLRGRLGSPIADELASQVFLIAFDRRAAFDANRADAGPWLYGIATNLIHSQRRQELRELRAYSRSGVESRVDDLDGIEARLDAGMMRRRLAEALLQLNQEELDVLALYAWSELSYAEIAEALSLPMGTVKSRLSRGRERIREQLEADRTISQAQTETSKETEGG
jgi:RNA polymerase sigma-70 factor, ECF subfamily